VAIWCKLDVVGRVPQRPSNKDEDLKKLMKGIGSPNIVYVRKWARNGLWARFLIFYEYARNDVVASIFEQVCTL